MGFWDNAVDQAGREFGARYWRWFAAARIGRRAAPAVSLLLLIATVGAGLYFGYRWLRPDWSGIGSGLLDVTGSALWWLVGAAVLAVLVAVGVGLWRAYGWRWRIWMRY